MLIVSCHALHLCLACSPSLLSLHLCVSVCDCLNGDVCGEGGGERLRSATSTFPDCIVPAYQTAFPAFFLVYICLLPVTNPFSPVPAALSALLRPLVSSTQLPWLGPQFSPAAPQFPLCYPLLGLSAWLGPSSNPHPWVHLLVLTVNMCSSELSLRKHPIQKQSIKWWA